MCAIVRRGAVVRVVVLALVGGACSNEPLRADIDHVTLKGEMVHYIASFADGHSEETYAVRPLDGTAEVPLAFSRDPQLASGLIVELRGRDRDGTFAVDDVQIAGPPGPVVHQAVIDGRPYRPRSFAFVLVDTSEGEVPFDLSEMESAQRLFGTGIGATPSVRQYYLEASFGRQDITGQVFGPVPFPMIRCDTGPLAQALTASIPGTFDHYLWYIHPHNPTCRWSGLAEAGRPDRPSRHTWYNASVSCVVLVQEPGHNLGMTHSSAMKCGHLPFSDTPSAHCIHLEYGDPYDPMGGGCRHMNAFQKASQGWFDGCNVVQASGSGSFTLLPLELACDGVQALQVPMPRRRPFLHGLDGAFTELTHYYLELRSPRGIDRGLGPVVQVRVSSGTRSRAERGVRTWFLDMDPATAPLDGLQVGGRFTDPTGSPIFTVEAINEHQATVRVELTGGAPGAATCGDGRPLGGAGPGPESCAAGPSGPEGTPPPLPPGSTPIPPSLGGPRASAGAPPEAAGCHLGTAAGRNNPAALALVLLALVALAGRRRPGRRAGPWLARMRRSTWC
jgi:hypothetical protein